MNNTEIEPKDEKAKVTVDDDDWRWELRGDRERDEASKYDEGR